MHAATVTLSRVRHRILALVFFAAMLCYLHRIALSMLAPGMAADLRLSDVQVGYIFSAFGLTYLIFEVPAGWLSDHWGQRLTMIRIGAGWSLFTILTGLIWSFWSLFAVRAAFGAAEAGAFPALSRGLARWFPIGERGRANGVMWMGSRLGGAIAPFAAALLSIAIGWRGTLIAFGVLGLIWFAAFGAYYRDDPAVHRSVTQGELLLIRGAKPPSRFSARKPLSQLLFSGDMLALFGMYFASAYGYQFFMTWLPTFLMREHGLSLRQSGLYSALPLAAGAMGCAAGGALADWLTRRTGSVRWGRRIVAVGGFTLAAVGFTAASFARSSQEAILCLTFAACVQDMTVPVAWATCVDLGGRFGGTASGFMNSASSIAAVVSPISAAWLAAMFGGFHVLFLTSAGLYLAGGLLWLKIDPARVENT